jgi:hypothetical protein
MQYYTQTGIISKVVIQELLHADGDFADIHTRPVDMNKLEDILNRISLPSQRFYNT